MALEKLKRKLIEVIVERYPLETFKAVQSLYSKELPNSAFLKYPEWTHRQTTLFNSLYSALSTIIHLPLPSPLRREELPPINVEHQLGVFEIPIGAFDAVASSKSYNSISLLELGEFYDQKMPEPEDVWKSYKDEKLWISDGDKIAVIRAVYIVYERGILGGRLIYLNSGGSHRFATLWRKHLLRGYVKPIPTLVEVVELNEVFKEWIENGNFVIVGNENLIRFLSKNLPRDNIAVSGSLALVSRSPLSVYLLALAMGKGQCFIVNDTLLTAFATQEANLKKLDKIFSAFKKLDVSPEDIVIRG